VLVTWFFVVFFSVPEMTFTVPVYFFLLLSNSGKQCPVYVQVLFPKGEDFHGPSPLFSLDWVKNLSPVPSLGSMTFLVPA